MVKCFIHCPENYENIFILILKFVKLRSYIVQGTLKKPCLKREGINGKRIMWFLPMAYWYVIFICVKLLGVCLDRYKNIILHVWGMERRRERPTIACILDLCVAFKVKGRSVYIELG